MFTQSHCYPRGENCAPSSPRLRETTQLDEKDEHTQVWVAITGYRALWPLNKMTWTMDICTSSRQANIHRGGDDSTTFALTTLAMSDIRFGLGACEPSPPGSQPYSAEFAAIAGLVWGYSVSRGIVEGTHRGCGSNDAKRRRQDAVGKLHEPAGVSLRPNSRTLTP